MDTGPLEIGAGFEPPPLKVHPAEIGGEVQQVYTTSLQIFISWRHGLVGKSETKNDVITVGS